MFSYFHSLLRNRELEIPIDGDNVRQLLRELRGFSYRLTDAGNVTFGAAEGAKDDVVYALGWALWALRHKDIQHPRGHYEPPVIRPSLREAAGVVDDY